MILAGDVGATKTHLAVISPEQGPRKKLMEEKLPSREYASLEALLKDFMSRAAFPITSACLGVAGPVIDGTAWITNLAWEPSEQELADTLGLQTVAFLNDLVAAATAVPHLEATDVEVLNEGKAVHGGTIGVIAPGTGLGQGYLTWNGHRYLPFPSEGGHTDFAPTSQLEIELLQYLWKTYDHVSYERFASGIGLPNIFSFLRDNRFAETPAWLEKQLEDAGDPTPVIVNAALLEVDPPEICVRTLEIFTSILGAECGNLAVKLLSSGGLYLGGGIPPRILPSLKSGPFMQSFLAKGRLKPFLENVPVRVILHPETALLGAAIHGLEQAQPA
jgi:glucokinase